MKLFEYLNSKSCVLVLGYPGKSSFTRYLEKQVGPVDVFWERSALKTRGDRVRVVELNEEPELSERVRADVLIRITEEGATVESSRYERKGEFLPASNYLEAW